MLIIYNLLHFFAILLLWPLILLFLVCKKKYRTTLLQRLGCALPRRAEHTRETIWVHALSVGEVTSALPLIKALRQQMVDTRIVLSVSTTTGKKHAETMARDDADEIIFAPADLLPLVWNFHRHIQPSIYIQIETDFWPNRLAYLKRKNIPTILVNGRVSEHSMAGYRRFSFFFQPMFTSFDALCMQTEKDRENMINLGVNANSVHTLGNLKFDTPATVNSKSLPPFFTELPKNSLLIVAGSTHPGEEQIIVAAFAEMDRTSEPTTLLIAPRDIGRCDEVEKVVTACGLTASRRSNLTPEKTDVIIIDTLGELVQFYSLASIAFVGGSLIDFGGHNPIEPASMEIPVLFGPHMADFSEIQNDLLMAEGALEVRNQHDLKITFSTLINSKEQRNKMGKAALECIRGQQGVIQRHIDLIHTISTAQNK